MYRREERHSNGYSSSDNGSVSSQDEGPIYLLEHLATFAVSAETGVVYPADGMRRLLQMEKTSGIWTQKMRMRIEKKWVVILDNENGDVVERFPMPLIREPTAFTSQDPKELYNNIFIFIVTEDVASHNPSEMHIFQCVNMSAQEVVEDVKLFLAGKGGHLRGGKYRRRSPATAAPEHPINGLSVREQVSIFNSSAANGQHRRISQDSESQLRPEGPGDVRPGPGYVRDMGTGGAGGADMRANYRDLGSADETSSSSSEKCERDVIVLNRCFDDIERFVARLQYTAAARKELERRRNNRKSKKKDLGDGMLSMRAKPPPDRDFVDLFQKFKLCFNLLAKLRDHIHDPNAPELVHFVFTPLALIVNASRTYFYPMDLAASVVAPLLTRDAIELLHNCLTSKENELWQSLGDAWLIPRSQWKGAVENYQPRFDDGWSPGFPVGRDREEEIGAQAAQEAKKRQLAAMKAEEEAQAHLRNKRYSRTGPQRTAYDNMGYLSHEEMQQSRFRERSPTPQSDMRDGLVGGDFSTARSDISADSIERDPERAWLEQLKARVATIVQVTYPRTGNNSKELTVERGEYLEVLDDSRKWWKVQNMSGKVGHVPNTIVTHYVPNDPQQGSSEQEDVFGNPVYSPDYHPDSPREGGMRRPPIQPAPPERIQKEMAGRKDGYEDWNQARWRRVSDVFPHGPPQLYRSHETHTVTPPVQPPPPPPPPPAPPQPPPAKEPPKARQPPIQQNPRPNDWSQRNGYSRNAPEAPIDELKEAFKTLRIRQKKLDVVQTPPVFITENSSANEVQDWLKQKLLPPQICEKLKGTDGKKLFRLTKEVCEKHFGRDEGSRLYSYITLSKNETKFNTASTSELMKILKERRRRAEKGNEGIPPEVLDLQDMLQDEFETDAPEMPPESQVQNGGIPRPTYNPLKRIAAEEATTNPNDAGGGSLRRQIEYQRLKLYGQVP